MGSKARHNKSGGPLDHRSVLKKHIDSWDRYRGGKTTQRRGSSNITTGVSRPGGGTGPGYDGGFLFAWVEAGAADQVLFDFSSTSVAGFDNASTNILVLVNGIPSRPGVDFVVSSNLITLSVGIGAVGAYVGVIKYGAV